MIPISHRILAIIVLILGFLALYKGTIAQNVALKGKTFIQQEKTTQRDSVDTGYYYQDSQGRKWPIYLSTKGNAYCWVVSKNNKLYKRYLPKVTEELNKKKQ